MNTYTYTTVLLILLFLNLQHIQAQCPDDATKLYSFDYNGHTYEVIKENKKWSDAAACAKARGGYLAHIDSAAENTEIFNQLSNNAGITLSDTSTSNGGNASYVWIGGNDITTEGTWIWDGDNEGASTHFWSGGTSGSAVNSLYNNWGTISGVKKEPDNYVDPLNPSGPDQDGAAIALNDWPVGAPSGFERGTSGQWNDISTTETLYYIVEHDQILSTPKISPLENARVYVRYDFLHIEANNEPLAAISMYAVTGQKVFGVTGVAAQTPIPVASLQRGVYVVKLHAQTGETAIRKVLR